MGICKCGIVKTDCDYHKEVVIEKQNDTLGCLVVFISKMALRLERVSGFSYMEEIMIRLL